MGEVAAVAQVLTHIGLLKVIQDPHRFCGGAHRLCGVRRTHTSGVL